MQESEATTLADARSLEREIMNEQAAVYRDLTAAWGLNYRYERAEFIEWVLAKLRDSGAQPNQLRFLDVGCGTGELLELLHESGCTHLAGLDLAEEMLSQARRFVPDADLFLGTVEDHPFEDNGFDVVIAAFTVHHLFDPEAFFRMVRDVLRPGGWFFILDYNGDAWACRRWTHWALRALVFPWRVAARTKNRAEIAKQPKMALRFNPAHRLLNFREFNAFAEACGLHVETMIHGVFPLWFNNDLFHSSSFDRASMRFLRSADRIVKSDNAGLFQWMHGRVQALDTGDPRLKEGQ